jgi:stage V sporulation protein B
VAGELTSALLCTLCYFGIKKVPDFNQTKKQGISSLSQSCRKILQVSTPLALNRMLLCVLQGIEAALLPQQIARCGLSSSEALSAYGTLSGMALPLLLFPTAITGSLGTLLLPAISEARVTDDSHSLHRTIESSFGLSFLLGVFCFGVFSLFGIEIGDLLFKSRLAGQYITSLAWLCPFLYLNTTLVHILHGLGRTFAVSLQSTLGFLVRLSSVVLLVPSMGIPGYFFGLFASELLIFAASLYTLHRSVPLHLSVLSVFLKPLAACILAITCVCLLRSIVPGLQKASWGSLILCGGAFSAIFLAAVYALLPEYRVKIRR